MKFLMTATLIIFFAFDLFALPLIFKITKKTAGEIAVVDTSKYEKVRILATASEKESLCSISVFGVEEKMEFILLRTPGFKPFVFNEMIDAPPAKLKFTTENDCTYSLFIYGK